MGIVSGDSCNFNVWESTNSHLGGGKGEEGRGERGVRFM